MSKAEIKNHALSLSLAGASNAEIAVKFGVSRGTVWLWLKDIHEDTETVSIVTRRRMESSRLDALQDAVWASAMSGNIKAINAARAIIALRVQLHGTATPRENNLHIDTLRKFGIEEEEVSRLTADELAMQIDNQ